MSTLKNLYISQSFQGLLHLGTNQSIANSIGQGYVQIQDGLGEWMSASIDSDGNLFVVNDVSSSTITTNNIFVKDDLIVSGNLIVHDNVELKGNVDITGSVTISQNLFVSGTLHSDRVTTTTISSSQIYSSGSNSFGADVSDTQTLIGQTTISGSLTNTGNSEFIGDTTISGSLTTDGQITHRGNVDITGSLKVSNEISSSTLAGIGNVEIYSQSVDSRLDFFEGPFSTSVDQRLDSLEFFSSSEENKNATLGTYTGSVNDKFDGVGVYTASMNQYTQSTDSRIDNIENYTQSLQTAFTASGTDVIFNGNINVSGSINAYAIHTIIESSSVIFSSGSNVFGDEVSDVQTLNGTVVVNNTLFVAGVEFIPFSQSVDLRLDQLEAFSSSLLGDFVTQGELAAATGALEVSIGTKLNTASFEAYTSSAESAFNAYSSSVSSEFTTYTSSQDDKNSTLASYTASIDTQLSTLVTYTGSNNTKWNTLGTQSGSWITTIGNNSFSGSNTFTGSVNGSVSNLSIISNTASLDCKKGNFFTITPGDAQLVRIQSSNIQPGQTISIRFKNPSENLPNVSWDDSFNFPNGAAYQVTAVNTIDIVTLISFSTSSLDAVFTKNLS